MTKILIAEDDPVIAREVQGRLRDLGYSVIDVVTSGAEALEKSKETHPDLMLIDIKFKEEMENIAGQTCNRFDLPVIYLNAYENDEIIRHAKFTEPPGCILKPFGEEELQNNIRVALYKHNVEKRVKVNREHLKNIIDRTDEIIFSIDEKNRVTMWNKTAEIITGYRQKEILRKPIRELEIIENFEEFSNILNKLTHGKEITFCRLILRTKKGDKRIIQISNPAVIKSGKSQNLGFVFVGRDITDEHENINRLSRGNSYFISDRTNESALGFLKILAESDNKCLFITRSGPFVMKSTVLNENIKLVFLRKEDNTGEFECCSDLEELTSVIKKFCRENTNSAILLDRVDYLLTRYPFEQFLESLYQINDVISANNSLFFIHFDSAILDERQIAILRNELHAFPNQMVENINIEDELFNILEFIYNSKQKKSTVNLKKIKREMHLTYPTISKRLGLLEDKCLIITKKQGRSRGVYISEKGEELVNKRKII